MPDLPNLGLATTKELIDELAARAHVAETVGEQWPRYQTTGEREESHDHEAAAATQQFCGDVEEHVAHNWRNDDGHHRRCLGWVNPVTA